MSSPHDSPLGKNADYSGRYDPGLLFPIARSTSRAAIGIDAGALPFHGVDIWNAYELSWLDARGKPEIALAEFRVPATTPNIVESKSFKLYLGSYNQERIENADALHARLVRDLSAAAGGSVGVTLRTPADLAATAIKDFAGESIDGLPIAIDAYGPPDPGRLSTADADADESLISDLLKTNCPVTGQPDWASIEIRYAGPRIDRENLLRYLVSFRGHADFHEHCVERIYVDLMTHCAPRRLSVYARYTRRGGLDINPWRSSEAGEPPNTRTARQ